MKPFIIAEMSCNHLGSYDRAVQIVKAASEAGADAVKLQVWSADTMCLDEAYVIGSGPWRGRLLRDLYREAYTPWEWIPKLFLLIRTMGMTPVASTFDTESITFLEALECPIYKIASFEITDLPLIKSVAATQKEVIISTGMATKSEIKYALEATTFAKNITLLKCTSAYPATEDQANLSTMNSYGDYDFGLSDHSPGYILPLLATAMGATVIEKHLTLSRSDGGPDAGFSMEPDEFKEMVSMVRRATACMGKVKYGPTESEASSLALRRSLYIAQDMKAGDILTVENLKTARPALGMQPIWMDDLLGKPVLVDLKKGAPLRPEYL